MGVGLFGVRSSICVDPARSVGGSELATLPTGSSPRISSRSVERGGDRDSLVMPAAERPIVFEEENR